MWTLVIHDWYPNLNKSRGRHWNKSYQQTQTVGDILKAEAVNGRVPFVNKDKEYTPVRAVDITLRAKGHLPDPDNLLKNTLDGLKRAGLIVDDNAKWCDWSKPVVEGEWPDAKHASTLTITITDADFGRPKKPTEQQLYKLLTEAVQRSNKVALGDVLWDVARELAAKPTGITADLARRGITLTSREPIEHVTDLPDLTTGDAIPVLQALPTGSVPLVFADPPFNIGYKYDAYNDFRKRDDYLKWGSGWVRECARVLAPTGSFFLAIGDEYAAEYKLMLHAAGLHFRNWIVWHYTFGEHQQKKFGRNHAHILYFTKDRERFTFNADADAVRVPSARQDYGDKRADPRGRVPGDVWEFSRLCGTFNERTGHPCQMPEAILDRIIRVASNRGDVVLDPFAGSGTTLAVARKLGRTGKGVELSDAYSVDIRSRLSAIQVEQAEPDPELFG